MLTKAYSYIRFSSKLQASGDSLRRQVEGAEKWASEHNLELDNSSYRDLGVSAFGQTEREGLRAFLQAIDSGQIKVGEYLIVESLDRLSRDPDILEAVELFLSIIRKGIILVTLSDGYIYDKEDLDVTKLIISITILARASNESKVKSDRLLASWKNKRKNISKKPMTSICPAWLALNDDRTMFVVVEERVALLNRIYQMARDGIGKTTIVRTLNVEGAPTWSKVARKTKGWQESYIHKLLTNRAVLGFHSPTVKGKDGARVKLEEVSDYYPQVISNELFYGVQRARKERTGGRKGSNYINLFQGLCHCKSCGSSMRLVNKGGKDLKKIGKNGARYYQCSEAIRSAGCQEKGKVFHSILETTFLEYVKEVDWTTLVGDVADDESRLKDEIYALKGELENLVIRLRKLEEAMLIDDDVITLAKAAKKLELQQGAIEKEIAGKDKELHSILIARGVRRAASVNLSKLKQLVSAEDRAKAAEIIKGCVTSIVIDPSGKPRPYYRINLVDGDYRLVWYLDNSSTGMGELDRAIEEEEFMFRT